MTRSGRTLHRRIPAVLLAALLSGAVLGGCGEDDVDDTTATDVDVRPSDDLEDPYDGEYTAAFREDLDGYTGLEVTLVGEVGSIVSPIAFTLTGDDVEPILVITDEEMPDLQPGQVVALGAEPTEEFELTALEQELGTDLPDEAYEEWEGDHFLAATTVEPRA
ncbi:hypothetical protein QOZ88_03935 [Blastococcus sp. BMG 814]|uniref:Lipoprotein n=1 Tax=Blastococcus carthaginiensis TaxID=3050034 RepID=A0ABT9I881_9ACTN|nr:hypothetical protein [Blastococcus carthaginiensis]MDP5181777.1 hypothetical protein [Blastococcus carthaginiensis]